MADHSERIAEIRSILRAGVSKVTVDGTSVDYDLASLRTELRDLQADDDTERHKRPRVSSINLGNA